MVRAIPINQWWRADLLERIRPGFALSAALHIGLLTALAYYLAFHPPVLAPPTDEGPVLQMVPMPPLPAKVAPVDNSKFKPEPTPRIDEFPTKVPPVPLPPRLDWDSKPGTTTTTDQPPAPRVVIDPQPIYRGGLIYPERAADAGKSGYVIFSFTIETDGSVGNPQVIEEVPDGFGFAAAAKKAFPKWRFQPQLVDGKPAATQARIRVVFNLT
jgi:TonB family protein